MTSVTVSAEDGRAPTWVIVLRVFAVLIGLRGVTNFAKPFGFGTAFVFFGAMVTGPFAHVLAVLFGVLLVLYAWGAWHLRRYALALGLAYAVFVALNIPLFGLMNEIPHHPRVWLAASLFLVIGVGITAGSACLLYVHRNELR